MFENSSDSMRINKFLSAAGYCSRREADRLVEAGKVTVDGEKAELGTIVEPGMQVKVNGSTVGNLQDVAKRKPVLLAVNKPVGIVCTTSDNDKAPNIVDMVEYPERVYPIGRLDKDSEGLMLLTNMGELVDEILRGSNGHEKEYLVRVDKALTEGFVDHMRRGVHLDELQVTTRPCKVTIEDKTSFRIILTQGLNRQIRRMCEALGFHVVSLKRLRIMNIRLGNLKTGTWRNVTPEEMKTLDSMLKTGGARDTREKTAEEKKAAGTSYAEKRRTKSYQERQKEYFRKKSGFGGKTGSGHSGTGGKPGAAGRNGHGGSTSGTGRPGGRSFGNRGGGNGRRG